ncbi:hypothetical protein SAMN02745121_03449 [Nannocystis exedens]|uniref:DUF4157 domain-containing protein n=2 Tax=Nannocystis exedens TaxID=54 RepID=A0A1I1YPM1_9BACT|nr:hypothetical protein [Nannocystis exedens]PCC70230.1 hypothetical protein NAEX_03263 [Nannocystis exedens]SFE21555.1 hypothetical protein SAMN02745121_03449 [Nannocystis exedens]
MPKLDVPPIALPPVPILNDLSVAAWAEAGRFAYPWAAGIMRARHANRPEHTIQRTERAVLRRFFGDLVDRVTVFYGADPLNYWDFGPYVVELGGTEAGAQNYGYHIYIQAAREDRTPLERLVTLAHELVHAEQYERFGGSLQSFGFYYFQEYKKANLVYRDNAFEEEAYGRVEDSAAFLAALEAAYHAESNPPAFCLVGVEAVLTIHNTTAIKMPYSLRWSELQPWKVYWLDPNHHRKHFVPNGCGGITRTPEIMFDHSLAPGYQKRYFPLDYTDQPEVPDPAKRPPGLVFEFKQVGSDLQLKRPIK